MLKYIAVLCMLLDHINKILFNNEYYILTLIGRLAYPLFIYLSVYAYIFYTSSKFLYIDRILNFALISQPFYMYAFNTWDVIPLNILFSICFGLTVIFCYEHKRYFYMIVPIFFSLFSDYSVLSIMLFLATYFFIKNRSNNLAICAYIVSLMALNLFEYMYFIPLFLLLLVLSEKLSFKTSMNKYFFYLFYPLHFLILGAVK